ncbi:MAG: hypothetical protein SPG64_03460 [Candidatus Enteromonas sp.]|nr:hypothetical protein [Candidatus Enteromonas sp.]
MMNIPIEEFHQYVGEILMYCQCIEENVKRICAQMMQGNARLNRLRIEEEKMTLGQVITLMKEMDERRPRRFFSQEDYNRLFEVTRTRNAYAHNVYIHFCYLEDEDEFERSYNTCVAGVMRDKEWLFNLYAAVEDARLNFERQN